MGEGGKELLCNTKETINKVFRNKCLYQKLAKFSSTPPPEHNLFSPPKYFAKGKIAKFFSKTYNRFAHNCSNEIEGGRGKVKKDQGSERQKRI